MIFRDFATRWLGSRSKIKIALFMLSGGGPAGEREIAKAVGISHVAASKALKEMESVNFLRKARIGNVNVWSLNERGYAYLEAKNLEQLAKNPPLAHLRKRLEEHFGEGYAYAKKVMLFGSIAEGAEKDTSDIDLFILVGKEADKKAVMKRALEVSGPFREFYGNSISPIIMTEKEAGKNQKLVQNISRGIVIK